MIYLDHNATTSVLPEVREAVWPFLISEWGNPSSAYSFGARAKAGIDQSREHVANLLNCSSGDVLFTSGATEANNVALQSAVSADSAKRHLVSVRVEHSSVLAKCDSLKAQGYEITLLEVDRSGAIDLSNLVSAIRTDTAVVSVMWGNNETGVIHPIADIAKICRNAGALFHCDAVQAVGKVSVDFAGVGCDYLSISGHKLGAPKGVGALIVSRDAPFQPLIFGGKQEAGRRGGTESVPLIVGLGEACRVSVSRGVEAWARAAVLRDHLENRILSEIDAAYVNGSGAGRLPNTVNFGVRGVDSDAVVAFMDRHDVCVSSGSACLDQSISPSHVVLAMIGDRERANEAVRVSLGLESTVAEVDRFYDLLKDLVQALR